MSTTRVRVDPGNPASLPRGRVDHSVLDGATEADLASQQQQDDAEATRDVARFAPPGTPASGPDAGGVRAAHRRAARDDPQLGTG